MYSIIPIHRNIKSAPASPGRSRVGPAFYVFSFLDKNDRRHVVLLERRSIMTTHFGKYSKRSPPCLWSGSPHLRLPGTISRRWNVRLRLSGYSLTPPLRWEISKLDVFCLSDHRARDFDAVQASITVFFPAEFLRERLRVWLVRGVPRSKEIRRKQQASNATFARICTSLSCPLSDPSVYYSISLLLPPPFLSAPLV